jgi:CPA1 family monovalent cation:H+ antiporter
VLEGESLVNDATALVAYRMAVTAVVTGAFSLPQAILSFVWVSVGGVALGLAVGWLAVKVRRRLDATVNLTVSVLTPFAAYLPAEALGVSGILATVTAGLVVGRYLSKILQPADRLQAFVFWNMVAFLLNGLAFILIGLQLHGIVEDLSGYSWATLIGYALLVSAAVILARLVWVFPAAYLAQLVRRRLGQRVPFPPWKAVVVTAWAGMRGVTALAAALALPHFLDANGETPFPMRSLILFLSFGVILATLVLQGLTLPQLIRRIGLREATGLVRQEESQARFAAAQAALERLEELAPGATDVPPEALAALRATYQRRVQRYLARFDPQDDGRFEKSTLALKHLHRALLKAERKLVIKLRDRDMISDDVLRRIERDLDLEELRLED